MTLAPKRRQLAKHILSGQLFLEAGRKTRTAHLCMCQSQPPLHWERAPRQHHATLAGQGVETLCFLGHGDEHTPHGGMIRISFWTSGRRRRGPLSFSAVMNSKDHDSLSLPGGGGHLITMWISLSENQVDAHSQEMEQETGRWRHTDGEGDSCLSHSQSSWPLPLPHCCRDQFRTGFDQARADTT